MGRNRENWEEEEKASKRRWDEEEKAGKKVRIKNGNWDKGGKKKRKQGRRERWEEGEKAGKKEKVGRRREIREEGKGGKKKRKQGRSGEYLGPRESSFGVNFHGAKLLTRVAGGDILYTVQQHTGSFIT